MRVRAYASELGVGACREAILRAGREETLWIDGTMAETPIYRIRAQVLQVRFKRALIRVIVHNWFSLGFSEAGTGGTTISVQEHWGLGPAWWLPGLLAGLFIGISTAAFGRFMPGATLMAAVFMQAMGFVISAIATASVTRGDRERLVSLLHRVAHLRETAEPRVAVDRAAPGR